jgi:hypothetical protein
MEFCDFFYKSMNKVTIKYLKYFITKFIFTPKELPIIQKRDLHKHENLE